MTGTTTYAAPVGDERQTTIAAGVGILATLAALGFWFWFTIIVIEMINPVSYEDLINGGGALSTPRTLIALVVAIAGTVGTWTLARTIVEG